MENTTITELDSQPWLDMEEFMNFSHETRLEGDTFERLAQLWRDWLPKLRVVKLEKGKNSWLAVWLPADVEVEVDNFWEELPSKGFMANNLAQFMCMTSVQNLLPQVMDGGCAPAPRPGNALASALAQAGLNMEPSTGALERRYAVVTHYPFKGGCEICALSENCPKNRGNEAFASVVLPGYER